ncbi:MAG: ribonuclease Z [Chlamydiae bacterium RIFCSPLOWO2_01_FULL_28_7]|nr:MAG: ribonuclease Z [Chlamydiae bacterium RIFCSPLOWO2_01_FULL_28_7]
MSQKNLTILGSSSQQPTRYRNHGAYLFRWLEEGLLFDPGEGTQRQFIFANIAPTCINRIFVSHFHGDHCLGLGSMLMRLNIDKIKHPVHVYYPAANQKNYEYLRDGCVYYRTIEIIEHPIKEEGFVEETDNFIIEAYFLDHGIASIGWRILEKDRIKFNKEKLKENKIFNSDVRKIEKEKFLQIDNKTIKLEEVSYVKKGDIIAVIFDSRYSDKMIKISKDAKILLIESTYTKENQALATKYMHMTAFEAAKVAKEANVNMLILTHFSARYTDLSLFELEAKEIFENSYVAEDLKVFNFPN